jgi:polyphosphate kinase
VKKLPRGVAEPFRRRPTRFTSWTLHPFRTLPEGVETGPDIVLWSWRRDGRDGTAGDGRGPGDPVAVGADLGGRHAAPAAAVGGRRSGEGGAVAVSPIRRRLAATSARPVRAAGPRPERLLNRELSWLDFDLRVLELAADPGVPLLERVRLCGIVSSNLDEFFAVRVAGLIGDAHSGVSLRSPDGRLPEETLADCRARVLDLKAAQSSLWLDDLRPALAREKIRVLSVDECGPREVSSLQRRFRREIEPLLTPIAVGAAAPFPSVPSLALNVGVLVADDVPGAQGFVRVNVPDAVPRFVPLGRGSFVLLEDAIVHFLPAVVGEDGILGRAVFRVTRDADFSISRDADDLLEAVETQLQRRRFAEVVRLEVDAEAPEEIVGVLTDELGVSAEKVYRSAAPLGLRALAELAELDRPDLRNPRWRPVTRRPFANRGPTALLAQIRRRDILVHHPYDSFDSSVGEFTEAGRDPKVGALKATVYRTDDSSPTLASLVKAAEEDKQAVCLVELKARFDERRNIEWSRALERAGVDVVYGAPDLKVHAKLALLVRRERGEMRRYVHIGTGNYHASNASNYEDLGLFTADEAIAADVADVFNAVTGRRRPAVFRKLLVGPWFLRDGILHEIGRVTAAARAGEAARIRLKVNSLVDPEAVAALYAASRAGVKVEIVARGICVLRPGVPGLSERITVRSVLGRFLEHSRILSFQAGDGVTTWIGSADLMPRNLDRRVEVLVPIEDARLRAEIGVVLDALLADTRFSWELDADGTWHRVEPKPGEPRVSAQETLMLRATKRAKKA